MWVELYAKDYKPTVQAIDLVKCHITEEQKTNVFGQNGSLTVDDYKEQFQMASFNIMQQTNLEVALPILIEITGDQYFSLSLVPLHSNLITTLILILRSSATNPDLALLALRVITNFWTSYYPEYDVLYDIELIETVIQVCLSNNIDLVNSSLAALVNLTIIQPKLLVFFFENQKDNIIFFLSNEDNKLSQLRMLEMIQSYIVLPEHIHIIYPYVDSLKTLCTDNEPLINHIAIKIMSVLMNTEEGLNYLTNDDIDVFIDSFYATTESEDYVLVMSFYDCLNSFINIKNRTRLVSTEFMFIVQKHISTFCQMDLFSLFNVINRFIPFMWKTFYESEVLSFMLNIADELSFQNKKYLAITASTFIYECNDIKTKIKVAQNGATQLICEVLVSLDGEMFIKMFEFLINDIIQLDPINLGAIIASSSLAEDLQNIRNDRWIEDLNGDMTRYLEDALMNLKFLLEL